MGNQFLALRKSEVAKVVPDRAALIGRMNQAMFGDMGNMKQIEEADRRWLCILFGEPYEAECSGILKLQHLGRQYIKLSNRRKYK